jgi:hypothetical protein
MTSECGCAGALGYDDDGVTSWKRSAIGGFTRLDGGSMVVGVQQRVVPRWYRMEFRGFSTVLRSRYFSFRDDRRLGVGIGWSKEWGRNAGGLLGGIPGVLLFDFGQGWLFW